MRRRYQVTTADDGLVLATESTRHTLAAIEGFGQQGATDKEWKEATRELGTGPTQYYNAKTELLRIGKVVKNDDTRRFIYSGSVAGVTEREELREPTGVDHTPDAESGSGMGESYSGGVRPESTGVDSLRTPATLRPYIDGVAGVNERSEQRGFKSVSDPHPELHPRIAAEIERLYASNPELRGEDVDAHWFALLDTPLALETFNSDDVVAAMKMVPV